MDVTFNFYDYYKPGFIDPLYTQYEEVKPLYFNPWTMNPNEIRIDWGYDFKKQFSHWPCPVGFKSKGIDFCTRNINQVPLFYTRQKPNYFWCNNIKESVFPTHK